MEMHATNHSMKRRTPWHNYSRKGFYMLTLAVNNRMPLLASLTGTTDNPHIVLTSLGTAIAQDEIKKIGQTYPMVTVLKACIMPDHIHIIVRVVNNLPKGTHLGHVIRGFKIGCTKAWWRLTGIEMPGTVTVHEGLTDVETPGTVTAHEGLTGVETPGTVTVPEVSTSVRPSLFEPGYNDKILLKYEQLATWKHYLDDNPRRLMTKRQHPELFTVLHEMQIAGEKCQIVGNRFLLDIPDKMAVIVHRRYTDDDNERLRKAWLSCGERGGVLVSAAIAPKERAILHEAMERGYRIILLRENGFPSLYKPTGRSFDACAKGLLLQISPWEFHMENKVITREQCLYLNAMAERIAENAAEKGGRQAINRLER